MMKDLADPPHRRRDDPPQGATHRVRRIVEKLDELGEVMAHFFGGNAKDYTD